MSKMSQFVENCGDGGRSNPLLNYVHQYTDDKSVWQDQFRDGDRDQYHGPPGQFGPGQFGPHFGPPVHPAMMEQQMVDEFLNPRADFERFEPSFSFPYDGPMGMRPDGLMRMPPQPYDNFMKPFHSIEVEQLEDVQRPQDALNIRNREEGIIKGPWEKESIEKRHGAWIKDYSQNREEGFEDLEAAWHPSGRTGGQRWAEEFPKEEEEFEDAYKKIEENNKPVEWSEAFLEEQQKEGGANWKDVALQASLIKDPALQSSQFMQFVNKMTSGELTLNSEGKLVPFSDGQKMANEFLANQPNWADQFEGGRNWAEQFSEGKNWAEQFNDGKGWAEQFGDEWSKEFLQGDWEEKELLNQYKDVWDKIQVSDSQYNFQLENQYLEDPEAFKKGIEFFEQGNLPEAILALEAAVQQAPDNSQAWCKLGMAHAENDKDRLAITALERSLSVDNNNLEALLSLAVSHTNEFHKVKAIESLYQWLQRNPKYSNLNLPPINEDIDIQNVEEMFIMAAKSSPSIDSQVHSALGLIYNLTFDYDKAIDCFRAALSERPDDYQLWNKLGATTANSPAGRERANEAIDAYFRALEKKPTYTRARANLGISYMAITNYTEAAKCFLGAVEINNTSHLWDNLVSAFTMMERYDLVEMSRERNVNLFRNEFDF